MPVPGCLSPGIVAQHCPRTGQHASPGDPGRARLWLCSRPVQGSVLVSFGTRALPLPWLPPGIQLEFAIISTSLSEVEKGWLSVPGSKLLILGLSAQRKVNLESMVV